MVAEKVHPVLLTAAQGGRALVEAGEGGALVAAGEGGEIDFFLRLFEKSLSAHLMETVITCARLKSCFLRLKHEF